MRTLFVCALAATLAGCTGAGGGFACLDRTAVGQAFEPEPGTFDADSATPRTRSRIAARTEKPSSARTRDKAHPAMKTAKSTAAATKVESAVSAQPAETSDAVLAKAKMTVAAKLEAPESAEFGEMKRAMRTNTLGQSLDTICGRVKGKRTTGERTGDMPFLYLVKDDEAYVVDGPPASEAAIAYGNICNSP